MVYFSAPFWLKFRSILKSCTLVLFLSTSFIVVTLAPNSSKAAGVLTSQAATLAALRISGVITGGSMPTDSAEFASMVGSVINDDFYGAALTAVQSQYGSKYLLRRLAFQMQNPGLQASIVKDNDATAFLIAHFAGAGGVSPSISKIWSNNVTCLVRNSAGTLVHAATLTNADLNMIDWRSALSCTSGQTAINYNAPTTDGNGNAVKRPTVTIPMKHTGGYVTLSDRPNDTSLAQISTAAGTNLRYISNLWMIATGMDLLSFAAADGRAQNVPRFVPENDPHFLTGNGQTACISCHGGGLVSLHHGYSTVADLFDSAADGFTYNTAPTTNSMKSLGSNPNNRAKTLTCNGNFTTCNSDSVGADSNQGWDLASTWGARGLLNTIGWDAPTVGQGLNSLGNAIGKSGIVYKNFVKRILKEVCPLGALPDGDFTSITQNAQSSDDIRITIAQIVSNPACR